VLSLLAAVALAWVVCAAMAEDGEGAPAKIKDHPAAREGDGGAVRVKGEGDAVRNKGEGDAARREGGGEGGEARRGDEGAKSPGLPPSVAAIAREANLSDAQKAALQEAANARQASLDQWKKDNAAKLAEAQENLRKAQDALRALQADQAKAAADADARMLAVFTPDQLAQYEVKQVTRLYTEPKGEGPSVMLTNEQKERIETLAAEYARKIAAGPASRPAAEAAAARRSLAAELQTRIYDDILLPEQRATAPKPPRVKAEAKGEAKGEGAAERVKDRPAAKEGGEG
jgi:hypothetical protein